MRAAKQNYHTTMRVLLRGLREAQRGESADYVNLQTEYDSVQSVDWRQREGHYLSPGQAELETEQMTALLLACEKVHEKCIHILLEFGADAATFRNTPALFGSLASKTPP